MYNVRPTDIQAAVGLVQLKRLESFLEHKLKTASLVNNLTEKHAPWIKLIGKDKLEKVTHPNLRRHSWMTLPFVIDENAPVSVEKVKAILEYSGVETRPILAGNLLKHPVMNRIASRIAGEMKNSNSILDRGFMIGCHSLLLPTDRQVLTRAFERLGAP